MLLQPPGQRSQSYRMPIYFELHIVQAPAWFESMPQNHIDHDADCEGVVKKFPLILFSFVEA